jgi:predicted transcriptional regulator
VKSRIAFLIYSELRREPASSGSELARRIESRPNWVCPILKNMVVEGVVIKRNGAYSIASSINRKQVNIDGNKLLLPNARPS